MMDRNTQSNSNRSLHTSEGGGSFRFLRKLWAPIMWGNLLAMILVTVLVIGGVWMGMARYTHHGEGIEVPDVVGVMESDARYSLARLGLEAVVVDSAYNKQRPAGSILEQHPDAGRCVKTGRQIYLTINKELSPTLVFPDIADNSSLREAQARLRALGFRLGPVEYVSGDRDWVYGVKSRGRNVYAGERVPIDVPLVLQVGEGMDELDELDDYSDEVEEGEYGVYNLDNGIERMDD